MESCCTCHISSSIFERENKPKSKKKSGVFRTATLNGKVEGNDEYYDEQYDDDEYPEYDDDYDSGDYRTRRSTVEKVRTKEFTCQDKKWNTDNKEVFAMLEMLYEENMDC